VEAAAEGGGAAEASAPRCANEMRPTRAIFRRLARSGGPIAQWRGRVAYAAAKVRAEEEFLLCTVTFHANLAHSLTRSP
jgi:hypothetical protein